jgi:hypothetical protein
MYTVETDLNTKTLTSLKCQEGNQHIKIHSDEANVRINMRACLFIYMITRTTHHLCQATLESQEKEVERNLEQS